MDGEYCIRNRHGDVVQTGNQFAFDLGTIVVHDGGTIATSGDANHDDT